MFCLYVISTFIQSEQLCFSLLQNYVGVQLQCQSPEFRALRFCVDVSQPGLRPRRLVSKKQSAEKTVKHS